MLSDEAVKEFQKLYKAQFGIELTWQDAAEKALRLLRLYKVVCRDLPPK